MAVMKALYGVDIMLGKCLLDYMSDQADRDSAKANIDRALRGETITESAWSGKEELNHFFFEVHHTPVYDKAGKIIGVAVLAFNLTEKKNSDELYSQQKKQINERVEELERLNKIMVDRELKMIELKNEIKQLKNIK